MFQNTNASLINNTIFAYFIGGADSDAINVSYPGIIYYRDCSVSGICRRRIHDVNALSQPPLL